VSKPTGELENLLGEKQRSGDAGVMGLPRALPADIPVGIAPGFPRHVYSTFDSRPIGAYDFAQSVTVFANITAAVPQVTDATYTAPDGYVTFLRRIEFTFNPALAVLQQSSGFDFQVIRDNAVVQNVRWEYGGQEFNDLGWNTAQIYQAGQQVGARIRRLVTDAFFVPIFLTDNLYFVTVRFIGTLIIDSGEPPAELVGSNEEKVIRRFLAELAESRRGGSR
jgi:hypothetical protein